MLTTGPYHITRLLRDRPHDGIAFHERYTGDNAMDIQARLRAGCEGDLRWQRAAFEETHFGIISVVRYSRKPGDDRDASKTERNARA